ncbi:MAG: hypothetical protein AB1634_18545, partial [Thermodesulfobacteriota bacterium]
VIDLIKKLGKGIEQLPPDKKMVLATAVKRFQEIEHESIALVAAKEEKKKEIERQLGIFRVIVRGRLSPRSTIMIENFTKVIQEAMRQVTFAVQDNAIVPSAL